MIIFLFKPKVRFGLKRKTNTKKTIERTSSGEEI